MLKARSLLRNTTSEVLMAVFGLWTIDQAATLVVRWLVTSQFKMVPSFSGSDILFYPEEGGSMFLQNTAIYQNTMRHI